MSAWGWESVVTSRASLLLCCDCLQTNDLFDETLLFLFFFFWLCFVFRVRERGSPVLFLANNVFCLFSLIVKLTVVLLSVYASTMRVFGSL